MALILCVECIHLPFNEKCKVQNFKPFINSNIRHSFTSGLQFLHYLVFLINHQYHTETLENDAS